MKLSKIAVGLIASMSVVFGVGAMANTPPLLGGKLLWVDATATGSVTTKTPAEYFQELANRVVNNEPFGWTWSRVVMSVKPPSSNAAYEIPGTNSDSTTTGQFITNFMMNTQLTSDQDTKILVNPYIVGDWTGWKKDPTCISTITQSLSQSASAFKSVNIQNLASMMCWVNDAQAYLKANGGKPIYGITFDFEASGIKSGTAVTALRNAMNIEPNLKSMQLTATGGFKNLAWMKEETWGQPDSPTNFSDLDELYVQVYNLWANECEPGNQACGGSTKYTYVGAASISAATKKAAKEGYLPVQIAEGQYTGNSVYALALEQKNPIQALLPSDPGSVDDGENMLYILYNPNGKVPGAAAWAAEKFFDQNQDPTLFSKVYFMFSTECVGNGVGKSDQYVGACPGSVSYAPGSASGLINAFGVSTTDGKTYSVSDMKTFFTQFVESTKQQGAFGEKAQTMPMNIGIYQYQMMPEAWFSK